MVRSGLAAVGGFGREGVREGCRVRLEADLEEEGGGCWRLEGEAALYGLHAVAAVAAVSEIAKLACGCRNHPSRWGWSLATPHHTSQAVAESSCTLLQP